MDNFVYISIKPSAFLEGAEGLIKKIQKYKRGNSEKLGRRRRILIVAFKYLVITITYLLLYQLK